MTGNAEAMSSIAQDLTFLDRSRNGYLNYGVVLGVDLLDIHSFSSC
jgi:hypothetical protein